MNRNINPANHFILLLSCLSVRIAICIAVCFTAGFASASMDDQWVGYYAFDGTLNDTSGSANVNNASSVGTPDVNAAGLFGKGVAVSGGNNYVTLGKSADYLFGSTTSFTFTYWLRLEAGVAKDPTLLGNKDWSKSGGTQGFVQAIAGDDVKANLADGKTRKDTAKVDLDPGADWIFCALVVDREENTMKNYVLDGNVARQWDDASAPAIIEIDGVGSLDSGHPINLGQDGDGRGYNQLNATFDDMGVWRRALAEYEIWAIYQAGRQGHALPWVIQNPPKAPPKPIEVEIGPYVQFSDPRTAVVRWDTREAVISIVEYGMSPDALTERVADTTPKNIHEIVLKDLSIKDKYFYRIGMSKDSKTRFSEVCLFDNGLNYARVDASKAVSPYPRDSLTQLYERAADRIVAEYGLTKGICLVYGCGEGRLAFELAKRTDMMIVGVDTDPAKTNKAITRLMKAGVYGARVTIRQVPSLSSLPFTNYMANLIVSDNMLATGQCEGSAAEMFRVLRPSGGVACLGQPKPSPKRMSRSALEKWLGTGSVKYTLTNNADGIWAKAVRPDLPGAGWWSHMYGNVNNNGNSNDSLEGGRQTSDFDVQWISWPGADTKADRQVRGQGPVTKNGRMVYYGLDRIITLDTYNGTILWSLEVPNLKRFNMPRDGGWICLDDEYAYMAVKDDCWVLNADTGLRTTTHTLNDPGYDWGCVFRYNDKLYGSAVIEDSFYTGWWSDAYWYETQDAKICSKYLFANRLDGSRAWTYHSDDADKGVIINSTICMGNGSVYFVESRNTAAKSLTSGRIGSQLWKDLYLVAVDAETGRRQWQKNLKASTGNDPVVANGTAIMHLMYSDDTLILESSDAEYYIYAYAATDGTAKWNKKVPWPRKGRDHGSHLQRVVISGGRTWGATGIKGFALSNGTVSKGAEMPPTNCGTIAAAGDVFLGRFNKGNLKLWDSQDGSLSSWERIRPGCYLNVIGSGGMVLAPEGGGGCDCYDGGFHTSVGFIRSQD